MFIVKFLTDRYQNLQCAKMPVIDSNRGELKKPLSGLSCEFMITYILLWLRDCVINWGSSGHIVNELRSWKSVIDEISFDSIHFPRPAHAAVVAKLSASHENTK